MRRPGAESPRKKQTTNRRSPKFATLRSANFGRVRRDVGVNLCTQRAPRGNKTERAVAKNKIKW